MASKTTQDVYQFIKKYQKQHKYPPTLREIGEGCFLSITAVTKHLDHLEGAGKLTREPGRARSITLLDDDDA